ncbi:MAG: pseudouridine synthase [Holosporaceae bacterium]
MLRQLKQWLQPPQTVLPPMRLAKYLAQRDFGTKRGLDRLISEKGVLVNGARVFDPAMPVTEKDVIVCEGKKAPRTLPRVYLLMYHKAVGTLTTHHDPLGRPTVVEKVRAHQDVPQNQALLTVGRLDQNSEGLLLLTNSGALKRFLELPQQGIERVYKVRFQGVLTKAHLASALKGLTIDKISYAPIVIERLASAEASFGWCRVTLREGKNREIRRVFAFWGLKVLRLKRIAFGPFELGDLQKGQLRDITHVLSF